MDWLEYIQNSDIYHQATDDDGEDSIEAYDAYWGMASPLSIELTAYRHNWQGNALFHLKNAHNFMWSKDMATWNDWTERRFAAHCEGHKIITMAGGANCGKSYDAAKLAILFWMANPVGRTVLVASTSLTDLDSRIWGYVKRFYGSLCDVELPGIMYTSPPPKILFSKEDTIHGMFAVPLQRGTPSKTASTLIGRHPDEGFLAVIDEGTDVSPGFMEAVPNWEKSPFFQMLVIGNSCSMFDPHGLLSRPRLGWDTVNPDYDKEWETKSGICIYFDCYDSPAIKEKDPVKKAALSKFLFTSDGIEKAKEEYGEKSPKFWRFTRGFWPEDDVAQTVLTAMMVDKFKAKEPVHWAGHGKLTKLAGLDPAFTPEGDECILRFATLGVAANGQMTLDYGGEENIHKLIIDAESGEPVTYQILNQVRNMCVEFGVLPENLAIDVWGAGTGLGDVFHANWSDYIYKVSSAGLASKTWVDHDREITARDVYDRRVTELWFSMQKFVQGSQIRGLDEISTEQFCTREYKFKGRKYSLETKEEYKIRLGKVDNRYRSPDRADAACLILDLARQFYDFVPGDNTNYNDDITPIRKYFNQQYRDGLGPEVVNGDTDKFMHPTNWSDGFSVSQFDVEEN